MSALILELLSQSRFLLLLFVILVGQGYRRC